MQHPLGYPKLPVVFELIVVGVSLACALRGQPMTLAGAQ
jgi:hypothetical protein